jgi:hypothetical protein
MAEPPRRTFDRGLDPDDDSFAITVILPEVPLCDEHILVARDGNLHLGWCDDERCRTYGEAGEPSPCGAPYGQLAPNKQSRSAAKRH